MAVFLKKQSSGTYIDLFGFAASMVSHHSSRAVVYSSGSIDVLFAEIRA